MYSFIRLLLKHLWLLVVLNVNHIEPVFDNKNMCLNLLKHIFDIEHAHALPVNV